MYDKWGGSSATLSRGCEDEKTQMAISSYLDGEANSLERQVAETHLAGCSTCRSKLSSWAQDSGRIRQSLQDRQLDWIARAIADQTRAFLTKELPQLRSRVAARPTYRPTPAPILAMTRPNSLPTSWLGVLMSGAVFVFALFGFSAMLMVAHPGLEPATPGVTTTLEQNVTLNTGQSTVSLMPRGDLPKVTPSVGARNVVRTVSQPAPTPGLLKTQPPVVATPLVGRKSNTTDQ